jgi:hypothetical protein
MFFLPLDLHPLLHLSSLPPYPSRYHMCRYKIVLHLIFFWVSASGALQGPRVLLEVFNLLNYNLLSIRQMYT